MSGLTEGKRKSVSCASLAIYLLIAAIVVVVYLPYAPAFQELPRRDSGVFLYAGQQITRGKIPYRDIWDHKGPLIYYINALGLAAAGGSRWGVWLLECLSTFFAAVFGQLSLQRSFAGNAAAFATVTWLLTLSSVLSGGNYTEEYALILQFSAIYFFCRRSDSAVFYFLIGITAALSFWLRPNIIGIWLSMAMLIAILGVLQQRLRSTMRALMLMCAGFATIAGAAALYFWFNDALGHFLDAAFRYNYYYSVDAPMAERLQAFFQGLEVLDGAFIAAAAAWLIAILYLFSERRGRLLKPGLVALALIAFPVEMALIIISGRAYAHYYISMLPVIAILLAFLADEVIRFTSAVNMRMAPFTARLAKALLPALFVAVTIVPLMNVFDSLNRAAKKNGEADALLAQVAQYAPDDDQPLLMWGAESRINYLLNRESPTRFVYLFPLITPGYVNDVLIDEFIAAIEESSPIIIDTSGTESPFPPIDSASRDVWYEWLERGGYSFEIAEFERVLAYVESHFEPVGQIEQLGWVVYQHRAP